jgi:CRISPR-associated endonuclease/helicase Cas3
MSEIDFTTAFRKLTGMTKPEEQPFPWQRDLYDNWFSKGQFPDACVLPTGLGKTSVIAVWLIALANGKPVPQRLVYVVNRRTVVDQTTDEVEKYRNNLEAAGIIEPLAISTLRGQYADNREWSADPSRPAVICGTVDMIGSRLLFSGYGIGFKRRPLHAGFLGQDALLVHDEAHLEPAFQDLVVAIRKEQERCEDFRPLRVMELTATSRGVGTLFRLTAADRDEPEVQRRIGAKKVIRLHERKDEKKLADEIATLALKHKTSGRAVLVFTRKVDDVDRVVKKLPAGSTEQLTGTIRGYERDGLVRRPVFQRFLPESNRDPGVTPAPGTVYLVCTSAGEVGVNISADHLVCDLTTFDSMAQRFGRVNRFGKCEDTGIDIVHPKEFDEKSKLDVQRKKTLGLLRKLTGDGSPAALDKLNPDARREAFAPQPVTLPTSDILFDAWALTTIAGKLPGRPAVEPYLHGVGGVEPPETHVAWRQEVGIITGPLRDEYDPAELLGEYPLKPHELLRDNSGRVFDRLRKLKMPGDTPIWLVADDDTVEVTTLAELIEAGRELIEHKTVLLPPRAGGLDNGMLSDCSDPATDVADELFDEQRKRRRVRAWTDAPDFEEKTKDMRLVLRVDSPAETGGEEQGRSWHWFELPRDGDTDGSKSNRKPVAWHVHTDDVTNNATAYLANLPLPQELKDAVILAAEWHDLGKKRKSFQTVLGNFRYPGSSQVLAKSGKTGGRVAELCRHEFASLVDVLDEEQPYLAKLRGFSGDMQDVVLHLIAAHHGYGRPHFPADRIRDTEPKGQDVDAIAIGVVQRFAQLQRRFGRWGLAYLESLLRAADYAASANPSEFVEDEP